MSTATLSAIFLSLAALIQSASYLCNKLPEARRPQWYPRDRLSRTMLEISWILLFLLGAAGAFRVDPWLGLLGLALYFLALPFLFQPALARLLGFSSLAELVDFIDRQD